MPSCENGRCTSERSVTRENEKLGNSCSDGSEAERSEEPDLRLHVSNMDRKVSQDSTWSRLRIIKLTVLDIGGKESQSKRDGLQTRKTWASG